MRLSKMIKLYRAAEGMDQKTMAQEIGVATSTLCRLEGGKSISLEGFAKLFSWLVS